MTATENYTSLNGKVAVLTGASRGLGKACADALIAYGAKVVIGDILEKEGQAVVETYNEKAGAKVAAFIRCDVTKYSDNIALFKLAESEFGGVDIALLNAGIGSGSNSMFTPLDDKADERIIDINATAVIKGTKVALLHMAKRGGGSIVHLASVAGFFSSPSLASYNASKHAVIGYTRSFRLMPLICNVRVNAICPFWVETDLLASINAKDAEEEDPMSKLIRASPRTALSTVVEGFLQLTTDETRNIETLMVLPEGLRVMEPLPPISSLQGEDYQAAVQTYVGETIGYHKRQLAAALERYKKEEKI